MKLGGWRDPFFLERPLHAAHTCPVKYRAARAKIAAKAAAAGTVKCSVNVNGGSSAAVQAEAAAASSGTAVGGPWLEPPDVFVASEAYIATHAAHDACNGGGSAAATGAATATANGGAAVTNGAASSGSGTGAELPASGNGEGVVNMEDAEGYAPCESAWRDGEFWRIAVACGINGVGGTALVYRTKDLKSGALSKLLVL